MLLAQTQTKFIICFQAIRLIETRYGKMSAESWYTSPHPTFLPENSGPIGREFETKLEFKQWSHWAHQPKKQRHQALRGTIGPQSCDP